MLIPAAVLVTGLFAVIFATERYGLRFGGVVVVPLLAMYVLFDYRALPLFAVSTATAYVSLALIERRIVLYGRRLFATAITLGALVPIGAFLIAELVLGEALPLREIAYVGSILPGIAAYNLHRLDREDQVADVVGSLALVFGLVALATFFLVPRALLTGGFTVDALLATAQEMLLGQVGPVLTAPAPVLPRWLVVGLFVLGYLVSELVRNRYGVRLAGVIAVPLVAVFALHDAWLLVLYLVAIALAGVFIRLVHRTTFLYGRNLLGGACIIGVVVAVTAAPFFPADVGLRPLIIGLLGGVTAYNGHVLSPNERLQSAVISGGSFVVLFAFADLMAMVLDRPYAYSVGTADIVIGLALLAVTAFVVVQFERLRPDEAIEPIANGRDTIVPDGGGAENGIIWDGGHDDPLAGRTVTRIDDTVRVVTYERGEDR